MQKHVTNPLTSAIREIHAIFGSMGFEVASGPELESEHYNFDALNVAKNHPARDMQDTFWVDEDRVLRTHDTAVTARKLKEIDGPMRFVSCGKAYRNEATDMTHEAQFYQVDAFAIGRDITLAHLKGTLETFFSKFLGGAVEIRFRPGFFPFVEPGVEVDMRLVGDNVPERLKGKWIEMLGAGMLHPNVLREAGVDPNEYQGWAFGGGIERLCMLKWAIDDVRIFHSGDLRFIQQFVSNGKIDMKVPYEWLQTFFDTLPPIEEVEQKLIFHAYEVEGIEDDVLDVDVLPNRAADSLSVRGIAREVSTLFDMPMKNDPLSEHVTLSPTTDALAVSIDDDSSCSYYIAAHITGVTVKESPEWLRRRLEAVGQKSINNIVDATNYVLFELGRPTHVFDADKLDGIHVRRAREGEVITLLGGTEATLTSTMTVIADAKSDAPLAVGGIKGGTHAEVDDTTTNIIIECANFDPTQTRVSAQALKMRTDASTRFENNMADVLADYGARRVVELILEIAGGQLGGFASAGEIVDHRREVSVSPERVNALLGASIATNDMRQILERIGCSVSGEFTVLPPQERRDIIIPEDVIEEIGRVYGYNNIVSKQLGTPERVVNINQKYARSEKVRRTLEALGYTEVYLYSLRDSGEVALLNSLASDKDHLRSNLTDGIVEALTKNEHNAPLLGLYDGIRLFEIGNVFTHEGETLHVGIGVRVAGKKKKEERTHEELNAVKEALEEALGVTLPAIEGETLEFNIEALDMPDIDAYEEGSTVGVFTYTPSSAYPFVLRDIAVLVPEGVEAAEVAECITSSAGELLVRVDLFDTFVKDGKTSYAYHLVFQSTEKTLTDAEVGEIMSGVEAALTTTHGWEIR